MCPLCKVFHQRAMLAQSKARSHATCNHTKLVHEGSEGGHVMQISAVLTDSSRGPQCTHPLREVCQQRRCSAPGISLQVHLCTHDRIRMEQGARDMRAFCVMDTNSIIFRRSLIYVSAVPNSSPARGAPAIHFNCTVARMTAFVRTRCEENLWVDMSLSKATESGGSGEKFEALHKVSKPT